MSNAAPVRCGFTIPYYLTFRNSGTTICNGSITFNFSGSFQFHSSNIAPQNVLPGSLQWSFTNLYPDEERSILVQLTAPLTSTVPLCNYAEIYRASGSQLVFEDGDNSCSTLSCSFDPNDKSVVPEGITAAHYTLKTDALEYIIRFQNLGNDTAFTVVIKDSLSSFLDWNSFELIASSFPCFTSLDANGLVVFRFENIRLPHDEANEPGSHGFVKYRIQAKSTIPEAAHVSNKANIYFDFNYPIATNTVFNTLVTSIPLPVNQKTLSSSFALIQPNPIQDKAVIHYLNDEIGSYDLLVTDLFGKTVYQQKSQLFDNSKSGKFEIDFTGFSAGIYLFKISSLKTGKSLAGKFVKL